jgi:hypothetical protein
VQLFYLSRIMGTSVEMIGATYGPLVPDSEDYLRGLLDDCAAESRETREQNDPGLGGPSGLFF